jgi:hypothetical protein
MIADTSYNYLIYNLAIFNRVYGDECHDLKTNCGSSGNLRTCQAGLYCRECPEDAGSCIRRCLINSGIY